MRSARAMVAQSIQSPFGLTSIKVGAAHDGIST